jgi:hypothetical protein
MKESVVLVEKDGYLVGIAPMSNVTGFPPRMGIGRRVSLALIGVLSLCLSGVSSAAQQDPMPDDEAAIKRGTELRRVGQDRAALAEFQRAVRLRETPRALAQLALAEQALGLWVDAHTHLTRALGTRDDSWIQKNRSTLETAQASIRSHMGQVEVWGLPNGAEVQLDGVVAGKLPSVTAWVTTGDVSLTVTAPGHAPLTRLLVIPSASRSREHVQLRPLAAITKIPPQAIADTRIASAADAPEGAGTARSIALDTDPTATTPEASSAPETGQPPIYKRWWFWTAIGVVALGTGATVYLVTRNSQACGAVPCDSF